MDKLNPDRPIHVVVAGQMPPPYGGQNINIKRVHDLLSEEPELFVRHLKFEFTKCWDDVRRFGISKILELFRVASRALKLRSQAQIDVLLYPVGGPHTSPVLRDLFLLPLLCIVSRRIVLHFRAAGLREYLASVSPLSRRLIRFVYQRCSDEAVVLTEFGRRDPEAIGISRISVIPNAFEDLAGDSFQRSGPPGKMVLSVGHLCEDKGTPQLIRAFRSIAERDAEARLVLVGEPLAPYTPRELEAEIERCGLHEKVDWKGTLHGDDLARAYRDANLFVFASVAPYESFGMVLIEAMHWGLPIIVTDWRANVSVCGETFGGVIARNLGADPSAALELALIEAWEQRECWPEWGARNRESYKRRFGIPTMVENFLALARSKS